MELEDLSVNAKTYDESYREFLMGFYNPELDAEIKEYLR